MQMILSGLSVTKIAKTSSFSPGYISYFKKKYVFDNVPLKKKMRLEVGKAKSLMKSFNLSKTLLNQKKRKI